MAATSFNNMMLWSLVQQAPPKSQENTTDSSTRMKGGLNPMGRELRPKSLKVPQMTMSLLQSHNIVLVGQLQKLLVLELRTSLRMRVVLKERLTIP